MTLDDVIEVKKHRLKKAEREMQSAREACRNGRRELDEKQAVLEQLALSLEQISRQPFQGSGTPAQLDKAALDLWRKQIANTCLRKEQAFLAVQQSASQLEELEQALTATVQAWHRTQRNLEKWQEVAAHENETDKRIQVRQEEKQLDELPPPAPHLLNQTTPDRLV